MLAKPLKVLVQHIWPDPAEDKLIGEGMRVVYQAREELMKRIMPALPGSTRAASAGSRIPTTSARK